MTWDFILYGLIGLILFYALCRMATYAIVKSWYQVKREENEKEDGNGKRQKKEAFIERRKT